MSVCISKSDHDNPSPQDLQELDRQIIVAAQTGLPLVARPYHQLAEQINTSPRLVMERMRVMQDDGRIRRIGAVPNHYRLGYTANGMSVWDVSDADIKRVGKQVGELDYVSHCYQRPRRLPEWPYSLFAMVHGHNKQEVMDQVEQISQLLGQTSRQHDVLFSSKILKKTGLRLAGAK